MIASIIVTVVLALCLLFVIIASYLTYRKAFHVTNKQRKNFSALPDSEQYLNKHEVMKSLIAEIKALPYEQVFITAFDGIKLAAKYYHIADNAPLQIEFHGYHGNAIRDFCGGNKLAREAGFNTLLVDQRAHGDSEGKTLTFGIKERRDCLSWIDYAIKRFGKNTHIFLAGISMGAATVLMAAELPLPPNVAGIIADCPYSTPESIIRKVLRDKKISPAIAMPFIRFGARLFGHFDLGAASALDAVAVATVPILLLHGEDDLFVPIDMSYELKQKGNDITMASFPNAGHGLSYLTDPARYANTVNAFIQKCESRFSE